MRFTFRLFYISCLLFLPLITWGQKDFKSSDWTTIDGQENHQGIQDFSGLIKVSSSGEKINIEADIIDENIVLNENHSLSDRLEIWLSIDNNPSENTYVVIKDSLTKYTPGLRFFKPVTPSSESIKISYGTVHYAILPIKEKKIHLLDRNHYDWIEKSTGEKPGHIEQGLEVKTEFTKSGYKLTISFSPLALGFIKLPSMSEIKLKLHVYDIDKGNSSSTHSITGSINEFQTIQFSKTLLTNVTSVSSYIFDSLDFHPVLMFNTKGFWSGVAKAEINLNSSDYIQEVAIVRAPIGSRKWKENKVEIEKISRLLFRFKNIDSNIQLLGTNEEIYFTKGKKFISSHPNPLEEWHFKGLQKEFSYQDQFPGIILIHIDNDTLCNNSRVKTLQLEKFKADRTIELLKIIEDPCKNQSTIGSLTVEELKIEKVYWKKEGVALIIEGRIPGKGEIKFRVGFQGDKAIITPIKK